MCVYVFTYNKASKVSQKGKGKEVKFFDISKL